jgi:hypothetical protein
MGITPRSEGPLEHFDKGPAEVVVSHARFLGQNKKRSRRTLSHGNCHIKDDVGEELAFGGPYKEHMSLKLHQHWQGIQSMQTIDPLNRINKSYKLHERKNRT